MHYTEIKSLIKDSKKQINSLVYDSIEVLRKSYVSFKDMGASSYIPPDEYKRINNAKIAEDIGREVAKNVTFKTVVHNEVSPASNMEIIESEIYILPQPSVFFEHIYQLEDSLNKIMKFIEEDCHEDH